MYNRVLGGVIALLHHRIVELRKGKRITQEVLAAKVGVTRSALSQYELGIRQPDYEIIKRLADYFEVSTDYLLGRNIKEEEQKEETEIERNKKELHKFIESSRDPKEIELTLEIVKKMLGK